jgi:ADP-ribose pyrophosphatase YjhB (NUDIX family)
MHHGAAVLFTNETRTLFLLQQKDFRYALHPYGFSFFGGKIKEGESSSDAALREITEELGPFGAYLLNKNGLTTFFDGIIHGGKGDFALTVFECALETRDFNLLSTVETKEGKGSLVVTRELLQNLKLIFNIQITLHEYFVRLPILDRLTAVGETHAGI